MPAAVDAHLAVIARSREHVDRIREATGLILEQLDALEAQPGSLADSVRAQADRLSADLAQISDSGEPRGRALGDARRPSESIADEAPVARHPH